MISLIFAYKRNNLNTWYTLLIKFFGFRGCSTASDIIRCFAEQLFVECCANTIGDRFGISVEDIRNEKGLDILYCGIFNDISLAFLQGFGWVSGLRFQTYKNFQFESIIDYFY